MFATHMDLIPKIKRKNILDQHGTLHVEMQKIQEEKLLDQYGTLNYISLKMFCFSCCP